jgi:hypothetical protein
MPRVARIRNNFFLFIFSSNTYFFAIPHNSRLPTSLCSGKILVWYKKTAIFGKPGFLQGISLSFQEISPWRSHGRDMHQTIPAPCTELPDPLIILLSSVYIYEDTGCYRDPLLAY